MTGDHRPVFSRQRRLHLTRARVQVDYVVRAVVGVTGRRQKLGAQHVRMGLHRELHDLSVEVGDGGGRMAAGDHPEGSVLDYLESVERRMGEIWSPDRCRVV